MMVYNFSDLKIPGKRELKIVLRRLPEPNYNIDISNWETFCFPENTEFIDKRWYIDVIP